MVQGRAKACAPDHSVEFASGGRDAAARLQPWVLPPDRQHRVFLRAKSAGLLKNAIQL